MKLKYLEKYKLDNCIETLKTETPDYAEDPVF